MVEELVDSMLQGGKFVKRFQKLLSKIRSSVGSEPESKDKRLRLDMEQLAGHLLFFFYTPALKSLRSIHRASELGRVQRILGCKRAALGSLSEALAVFDPEVLQRAIAELVKTLSARKEAPFPKELKGLTAVDGTFLKAVPRMAWALFRSDSEHRGAKAHVLFDVALGAPVSASVTAANASEKIELSKKLKPGLLYVMDAGYAKYKLFSDIIEAGSSFVCRVRNDAVREVLEERDLSEEASKSGILKDQVVRIGDWAPKKDLEQKIRLVEFQRPRTREDEDPEIMVLATDRLDLDAELVALAYRYRWSVELFFRWFKCILGCKRLVTHSEGGVAIQVYAGIIASLLISVWLRRKPNQALLEMISFYLCGMATDEELERTLSRLKPHKK